MKVRVSKKTGLAKQVRRSTRRVRKAQAETPYEKAIFHAHDECLDMREIFQRKAYDRRAIPDLLLSIEEHVVNLHEVFNSIADDSFKPDPEAAPEVDQWCNEIEAALKKIKNPILRTAFLKYAQPILKVAKDTIRLKGD